MIYGNSAMYHSQSGQDYKWGLKGLQSQVLWQKQANKHFEKRKKKSFCRLQIFFSVLYEQTARKLNQYIYYPCKGVVIVVVSKSSFSTVSKVILWKPVIIPQPKTHGVLKPAIWLLRHLLAFMMLHISLLCMPFKLVIRLPIFFLSQIPRAHLAITLKRVATPTMVP